MFRIKFYPFFLGMVTRTTRNVYFLARVIGSGNLPVPMVYDKVARLQKEEKIRARIICRARHSPYLSVIRGVRCSL